MKKWICMLLALCLLLPAALSVQAAAGDGFFITPSADEAQRGQEIGFRVTFGGSQKCDQFGLLLQYDREEYEMVGGQCTVTGALIAVFTPESGFAVSNMSPQDIPGEIGSFTLRVREDAPLENLQVTAKSSVQLEGESVPCSVAGAVVKTGTAEETEPRQPDATLPETTERPETVPEQTAEPALPETTEPVPSESAESTEAPEADTVPPDTARGTEAPEPAEERGSRSSWYLPILSAAISAVVVYVIMRKRT